MKVKIFSALDYNTLEENINDFLSGDNLLIQDIKINTALYEGESFLKSVHICTALIMYDDIDSLNN